MNMFIRTVWIFIALAFLLQDLAGQKLISDNDTDLSSLVNEIPALEQKVSISVSNVAVSEFLRAIASSAGLNINVAPDVTGNVINNFREVRVLDILLFLADEYQLDISVTGNIVNAAKRIVIDNTPPVQRVIFDSGTNLLTLNFQKETLQSASREITAVSGRNVVIMPGTENFQVSGFIKDMPFDNALEKFTFSNSLEIEKTEDGFYIVKKPEQDLSGQPSQGKNSSATVKKSQGIEVIATDSINIYVSNVPVESVVREISDRLGISYYISTPVTGNATLNLSGLDYEEALFHLLNGSQTSFIRKNGVYIFTSGNSTKEYRVLKFRYRTISKVLEVFPESLKTGMELKELPELNSIIAGGPSARLNEIEDFIQEIDKTVPVVLIEVMLVYADDNYTVTTGIEAGLSDKPVQTGGTIYPGIDLTLNAEAINKLLSGFEGFSSMNLGRVNPNFYASLKVLETQGIVDISSTPRLSTMNGYEATMSIGNTEYYLEQSTNIYGTQDPQIIKTDTYKSVDAELSIVITPMISGDNQITLDIEVSQSDFTGRIAEFAPPGKTTRNFKSMIRVMDQETILLGGLEEKRMSDNSSGIPFLSRIPGLKWLFSSRSKVNEKTRLNVFIKPTIIN